MDRTGRTLLIAAARGVGLTSDRIATILSVAQGRPPADEASNPGAEGSSVGSVEVHDPKDD